MKDSNSFIVLIKPEETNRKFKKTNKEFLVKLSNLPMIEEVTNKNFGYNFSINYSESNIGFLNIEKDTLYYKSNSKRKNGCEKIETKLILNSSRILKDSMFIYNAGEIVAQIWWLKKVLYLENINDSIYVLESKYTKHYMDKLNGLCYETHYSHSRLIEEFSNIIISKKYGFILFEYLEEFGNTYKPFIVKAVHPDFIDIFKTENYKTKF